MARATACLFVVASDNWPLFGQNEAMPVLLLGKLLLSSALSWQISVFRNPEDSQPRPETTPFSTSLVLVPQLPSKVLTVPT